jgi:broad specificity phosphatase PhoE
MRHAAAICLTLGCLLAAPPASAQEAIFVVRHAEKVDDSTDAALSPAGEARAAALARTLRTAGITAVYATEFQRTVRTAAPLADMLKLPVTTVPANDQAGLIARVRAAGPADAVLIVGHSNTVPAILKALGCTTPVAIADDEYDNLFVVIPRSQGAPTLLRLRF